MNAKNHKEYNPLPPPPSLTPKPLDADRVKAGNPSVSIIERLASLADKSEVMSLLEFKEEQKLDKNDPLWAFLLQFKTIENSVNKQEQILNLLIRDFEAKFEQQIDANQQRLDTSFRTYSQDLINQYQALTNNLQTVEEASLNLTQAKISGSVSKLVRHAAHTKAVSDWLAMSRLGLYILIPMMITAFGGWFARSYLDYRYSNSGLSNQDTALLHWAKSDEGKLAKNLANWNSRGLTTKGKNLICEREAVNLDVTLTLEGKTVTSGWCALWIRPADQR
ncbi:hypothetical protein C7B62_20395 [Pleurocapsa sp. CCALA 161]|uniref:DUF6753 family protein n=1 Tax=Pleurocapsa sp. CCALA 161 TaxID=2107688 RepID=UPI000D07807C|nr:DUF6753 family protein [Pleurocapsa sp. CCALA 161]PSB07277.1 hypothetical protein C7B62_20395 [Pleurocapsa sp. CCALA 161]